MKQKEKRSNNCETGGFEIQINKNNNETFHKYSTKSKYYTS